MKQIIAVILSSLIVALPVQSQTTTDKAAIAAQQQVMTQMLIDQTAQAMEAADQRQQVLQSFGLVSSQTTMATTSSKTPPAPGTGPYQSGSPGTGPAGYKPLSILEDITCIEVVIGGAITYWVCNRLWNWATNPGKRPDPVYPPISTPPWTNSPNGPLPAFVQLDMSSATGNTNITAKGWVDNIGSPASLYTNQISTTLQATTGLKQLPWTNALHMTMWFSASGGVLLRVDDPTGKPIMTNYAKLNSSGGAKLFTPFNVGAGPHTFYRGSRN